MLVRVEHSLRLLSGEAALFQTGGLGGLTIVPPKNGPLEARPESTTSLRSDFVELGLGSEHPINSTLRFGNCVCFGLRPRLRGVAMQNWEAGVFGEAVVSQIPPLRSKPMVYPR